MRNLLLILCFVFSGAIINQLHAQKAEEIVGKKASEKNLSNYQLPTEDVQAEKPDPSRAACCLNFDNWTGYVIHVWVDDYYVGTVGSWSEDYSCVQEGWTTWYARTAGGTYEWWGEGQCSGNFNLVLN